MLHERSVSENINETTERLERYPRELINGSLDTFRSLTRAFWSNYRSDRLPFDYNTLKHSPYNLTGTFFSIKNLTGIVRDHFGPDTNGVLRSSRGKFEVMTQEIGKLIQMGLNPDEQKEENFQTVQGKILKMIAEISSEQEAMVPDSDNVWEKLLY